MQSLKAFKSLPTHDLFDRDISLKAALGAEQESLLAILQEWQIHIPHWNALADEASRPEKLPRVKKYDHVGNRVEDIILPPETETIRREVVENGIFNNRSEVEMFAKIYLLAQIGESGVTCPLACTDGLRRVIMAIGSDFLKKEYLPLLVSATYPLAGAQFVTEQSGGSDVGAIQGTAREEKDGTWRITAEKWYCSAIDEFFMVVARPDGAPEGTEGLSIFFVPRTIQENGKTVPNHLSIRRLKDKLGTQSLPTAEVDFEGSVAYVIGKKEEGFHNLMTYILNVSRIHNAANSLGFHRRSFAEARNYAEQRRAFGKALIEFPLIQEYLLSSLSQLSARLNYYVILLKTVDEKGLLPDDPDQRLWQRFMVNLTKYRTASNLTEKVKEAILVFGANGIIQDFTIVPRLLRDSLIVETWEGPHNTLCLQILRDSRRFDFFGRMKKEIGRLLEQWPEETLGQSRRLYAQTVEGIMKELTPDRLKDAGWVQTHAKRIVDVFGNLLEIGELVALGVKTKSSNILLQASYLTHSQFEGVLQSFSSPVLNQLREWGVSLVREEPIQADLRQF